MHAIGETSIESLAKLEINVRVGDGIAQPRQHFAVVVQDIAVVNRNDVALLACQNITVGHPAPSALARRPDAQVVLLQHLVEG